MKQKFTFILAALFFLIPILLQQPFGWQNAKFALLTVLLLIISLIDYRYLIIPDELLLAGLLGYVLLTLAEGKTVLELVTALLLHGCSAAMPLFLFVLAADRISGAETMGFGDIKLFYLLGVYLGAGKTWLTLFLSCVAGLIFYGARRKQNRGEAFAFGPSIALAAWTVILWGEPFMDWYIGVLF